LKRGAVVAPKVEVVRAGYHTPHGLLGRKIRQALVIGAGTGNDVSVLLDEGAERVDAVEIDPRILQIGRARHPDHPYDSPRVHLFNTDARAYLNDTKERYDLIVFGTLDSMTRLSALSNVRLDNFVYTVDCLRAAQARLTDDGGVALYFMAGTEYIDWRLQGMVAEAFSEVPLVVSDYRFLFNRIYMAGPGFAAHEGAARRAAAPEFSAAVQRRVELPTDDWPFLYLAARGIGRFYVTLILVFAAISVSAVLLASHEMRESLRRRRPPDWEMFVFGLGFLLLEARSVTEMSLAWGATWLTSAVVFGSILLVVLLATLASDWRPMPYGAAMGGLVFSLLALYMAPARWLLFSAPPQRLLLSVLFVGGPMYFAASAFATLFRERASSSTAFGWNLLGAVAGGLLEMTSMELGLKALLLLALGAYLAALLVHTRSVARTAEVVAAGDPEPIS
ncbi:MAG: spermidine synthase, partial [bacterium]